MRFRHAHKTTTYLVVLSSFFAVGFSGLLNPLLLLVAFLGIVGSWFWEPPRIRFGRWSLAWTILAALVFAYQFLSVLAGAEVLFAGTNFLIFLLIVKLFNRQESKDYQHIYIISFLMLTAGTVLNAEITYGFFFLCYVISSTWALIIFHLRRELENNFLVTFSGIQDQDTLRVERVMNSRRIVDRKFFWGTGAVAMIVFLSSLSLFLLFPRIGFGFFFDKGRGGITMAGFSDGVQLGGHGLIKQDKTVVMRVQVGSDFEGRSAPYLHWRGVAFDNYSRGQWSRTRRAPMTRYELLFNAQNSTHHLLYTDNKLNSIELRGRAEKALRQDIYLEPVGYDVLFGASMPLAFEFDSTAKNETRVGQNDELRHVHTAGIKYTVYSDPFPPDTNVLRSAPNTLPPGYEVYLQIPDEIPECESRTNLQTLEDISPECRVRDLARFITRNADTNYDKALALESWLRNSLGYTLQQEAPGSMEPVEFFLFERQKGHCEYFSSAMAIMARSVGVPTRNVNGFLGGEWNEYSDYIAVRAGDAHSWVEVYFDGQGWVTFDPTPGGQSDLMGRGDSGILDRLRRIADTLRFKWFKWVIEYDLYAQLKLFKNVGSAIKGSANTYFKDPLNRFKDWAKRHKGMAGLIIIILSTAIFFLGLRKRRRSENSALAPIASKRTRDPVIAHYLAALRALAKRGFRRNDATTPREFATRLRKSNVPGARSLRELTELYYEVEYSTSSPDRGERAKQLKSLLLQQLKEEKVRQKKGAPPI